MSARVAFAITAMPPSGVWPVHTCVVALAAEQCATFVVSTSVVSVWSAEKMSPGNASVRSGSYDTSPSCVQCSGFVFTVPLGSHIVLSSLASAQWR